MIRIGRLSIQWLSDSNAGCLSDNASIEFLADAGEDDNDDQPKGEHFEFDATLCANFA